jgi:hypothetical protein
MKNPIFSEMRDSYYSRFFSQPRIAYATVLTEAHHEKELVENIWLYLNPFNAD